MDVVVSRVHTGKSGLEGVRIKNIAVYHLSVVDDPGLQVFRPSGHAAERGRVLPERDLLICDAPFELPKEPPSDIPTRTGYQYCFTHSYHPERYGEKKLLKN